MVDDVPATEASRADAVVPAVSFAEITVWLGTAVAAAHTVLVTVDGVAAVTHDPVDLNGQPHIGWTTFTLVHALHSMEEYTVVVAVWTVMGPFARHGLEMTPSKVVVHPLSLP